MAKSNSKKQKNTIHTSLATPALTRGNGAVRIVSGRWRKSLIHVSLGDGIRPTSERVRETVFDWLAHLFEKLEGI
ncbi:RNA methyltransferase, RsmD family, partial [gut metagenome]